LHPASAGRAGWFQHPGRRRVLVVYYTGDFYRLTVEPMSLALGVPTIPYQLDQLVFGKWTGVGGGFVQPGVGQPENATFPAVSYVNTGAVQLFSLSKTFQGMTCKHSCH